MEHITAKEAAKIAYDANYSNIDSKEQLKRVYKLISDAAKSGKHHVVIRFLTGQNINQLKNEGGFSTSGINSDGYTTINW